MVKPIRKERAAKAPKLTQEQKELRWNEFITAYVDCGGRRYEAGKRLGLTKNVVSSYFKEPTFLDALSAATEHWHEDLRSVAIERAKTKSDILLIFLLKALRPDLYDDEVRKHVWMDKHGISDQTNAPMRAILVREEIPVPGMVDISQSQTVEENGDGEYEVPPGEKD